MDMAIADADKDTKSPDFGRAASLARKSRPVISGGSQFGKKRDSSPGKLSQKSSSLSENLSKLRRKGALK